MARSKKKAQPQHDEKDPVKVKGGVKKKAAKPAAASDADVATEGGRVLRIEASKECGAFKTRAAKIEKAVKEALPDVVVEVNKEKPRKGAFVISDGATTYVELLDMPRPFTKMKAMDMDELAEKIIAGLKSAE